MKAGFLRSVILVAGGTAGAQFLMLLAAPILTRLYSPSDFGLVAVFAGLLTTLLVISSLRYDMAVPLPEEDREAANVLGAGLVVLAALTAITLAAVVFFRDAIASAVGAPALSPYLLLLPLGLALGGAYQVTMKWAVRKAQFKLIAKTKVTQSLGAIVIQIGGYSLGPLALILGQIASHGAGITSLVVTAGGARTAIPSISWQGVRSAISRYRNFPIFSTWGAFFNTLSGQLPAFMLTAFFGPVPAGLFALTMRVLAAPMTMIGRALGDVFFSGASESLRSGRLGSEIAALNQLLTALMFPAAAIGIVVAPVLFRHLFGEAWSEAGPMAQWLLPFLVLQVASAPFSTAITVMEKQWQATTWHGCLLIARAGALAIGGWFSDVVLAIALFSIVSCFAYLFLIGWVFRSTRVSLRALTRSYAIAIVASAAIVAPLALAVYASSNLGWLAAGSTASAVLLLIWYGVKLRPVPTREPTPQNSIFLGGDLFLSTPAHPHNWDDLFRLPDYRAAKYKVLNLEAPITDRPEHADKSVLWSGSWALQHLADAAPTALMLANNHAHDKLEPGLRDTIDNLRKNGITPFGAGRDIDEAAKPIALGNDVYVLGFCEFGKPHLRQIKVADRAEWGVNPLTYDHITASLDSLPDDAKAILLLHWGREHTLFPPPENILLARRLLAHRKVTAIVAHHPHVAQGYVSAHGKRAYMSIGHALFDEFYFEPPCVVAEMETKDAAITYDYHRIKVVTRKRWRRRSRASIYVLLDPLTGEVCHRPIWQERGTPVVRAMSRMWSALFLAKLELLSTLYAAPAPIYRAISTLTWRRRQYVNLLLSLRRIIRDDGIVGFAVKVRKRIFN